MFLSSTSFLNSPFSLPTLTLTLTLTHPSPFINASIPLLPKLSISSSSHPSPPPPSLSIHAMKKLQGRVVCAASDKTVAVEVIRLAPHPKYKRRVRKKKKYQAHDPDNQFKIGDFVQLEKSRPISKTKAFVAVPVLARNRNAVKMGGLLDLPRQSEGKEDAADAEEEGKGIKI